MCENLNYLLALDIKSKLAETPCYDAVKKKLYWTDLFAGEIHEFDPSTGQDKAYETGKMIGSAILYDENRMMCASEDGMYVFYLESEEMELYAAIESPGSEYRLNDARCDAKGRIFTSTVSKKFGTPEYSSEMKGNFYMVDLDGSVTVIEKGINQYNGIVFNKSNTVLYVVDTFNNALMQCDYDLEKGVISPLSIAIQFPEDLVSPDGMAIDVEDNVYIAYWNGFLCKWNPVSGELLFKDKLPCDYVCCPGFGGKELKDLYITTSSFGFTENDFEQYPGAGGIFSTQVDVPGRVSFNYQK